MVHELANFVIIGAMQLRPIALVSALVAALAASSCTPAARPGTSEATTAPAASYTNLLEAIGPVEKEVSEQPGGTHADEIETSMVLYIDPASVDMSKAVKDYHPNRPGGLTRDPNGHGTYSPTGIWGDATLATREKGERVVEALVVALLRDIDALRTAPLPTPVTAPVTAPTGTATGTAQPR